MGCLILRLEWDPNFILWVQPMDGSLQPSFRRFHQCTLTTVSDAKKV